MLWLTIAGIIGYLYPVHAPFRLPWNADVALTAVIFYGAGDLFRKFNKSEEKFRASSGLLKSGSEFNKVSFLVEKSLPGLFILVNLLYFMYLLEFPTDKINMNIPKYGDFFSFYFLAFSGIFTFVYLSKKVGSLKVLEYYVRNSLIVLALRFPMKDVLTKLAVLIFGIETDCFFCTTFFALVLTGLNLLILAQVIFLINITSPS
jgi:hypothetical protein